MLSDISGWIEKVEMLNSQTDETILFKCREVWQCFFGLNVGREQNGDPTSFLRPVLVFQRFGPHIFWGVPLSTKTPLGSMHHHLFWHDNTQYSALVTQLRALDSRRLQRRLYTLDNATFGAIQLRLGRILHCVNKIGPLEKGVLGWRKPNV